VGNGQVYSPMEPLRILNNLNTYSGLFEHLEFNFTWLFFDSQWLFKFIKMSVPVEPEYALIFAA
jgi:hypothetical protein